MVYASQNPSTKYKSSGQIEIDGNVWSVVLPGANTELTINKYQRWQKTLQKKVDNDTATEEDLDKYDMIEEWFLGFFKSLFKDDTPDNKTVNDWVDNTPLAIIVRTFEDIRVQADKSV